eukprot:TRINITY_DN17659_c0_g1_i5.p1 TRINITY_DN17659_c0_g1~~TRINITY_DN17659_c0_g1_i5.p1  ORF type:complete len:357 (+),score=66.36 TRINITY_DN17659_c0_g1_i5:165-1235(+)
MGKMTFLAGNLTIQFSVDLRSRNLLIPWVKKASAISCSKASQSYFMRCICRNYFQSKGGNSPRHSSYSTFLKDATTQGSWILHDGARYKCSYTKRIFDAANVGYRLGSYNVHNMDIPFFGNLLSPNMLGPLKITRLLLVIELSEDDIGHDLGVEDQGFSEVFERPNAEFKIFNDNDASEMDAPSMSMAKQDARTMAIEVLAKRALTTVELHKKLRGKKFPLHEVEAVIADFQGRGLLNDYLYAETFSRSRWFSLSWGPRRIKQALLRKGVTEQDAERAMKEVFEDGDCGADQGTHLGMSKISLDRLLAEASKQWLRGKDVPLETRKSRIVRWLQYRGFNWGITIFVLKKLESQHPP